MSLVDPPIFHDKSRTRGALWTVAGASRPPRMSTILGARNSAFERGAVRFYIWVSLGPHVSSPMGQRREHRLLACWRFWASFVERFSKGYPRELSGFEGPSKLLLVWVDPHEGYKSLYWAIPCLMGPEYGIEGERRLNCPSSDPPQEALYCEGVAYIGSIATTIYDWGGLLIALLDPST